MAQSSTYRISAILSAVALAVAIGIGACPGHHGSSTSPVTLLSVAVTPANPTVALGTTRQLTATGTYSNGTSTNLTQLADWSSSNAAASTVSPAAAGKGLAAGLGLGSATISATYGGKSGWTTLTVTSANLVALEVTPTNPQIALGTSRAFTATGRFTDGTTQDLTEQVVWESSVTAVSTISIAAGNRGLAHSAGLGDTTITASLSGVSGSTTLTVSSAVLVSLALTPTDSSVA